MRLVRTASEADAKRYGRQTAVGGKRAGGGDADEELSTTLVLEVNQRAEQGSPRGARERALPRMPVRAAFSGRKKCPDAQADGGAKGRTVPQRVAAFLDFQPRIGFERLAGYRDQ